MKKPVAKRKDLRVIGGKKGCKVSLRISKIERLAI